MVRGGWAHSVVVAVATVTACTSFEGTGPPSDAGADSSVDAAAADGDVADGGSYCTSLPSKPSFCDDFDDGAPLTSRWQITERAGGGVALGVHAASKSFAVSYKTPAVDGGEDPSAFISRKLPQVTSRVRESFALRIESFGGAPSVAPVTRLRFEPSGSGAGDFLLVATEGRLYAYERLEPTDGGEPAFREHTINGAFTKGRWTRVEVEIVFEPKPSMITVRVDGIAALGPEPLDPAFASGALETHIGLDYTTSPSGGWEMAVDDVVVDWQ